MAAVLVRELGEMEELVEEILIRLPKDEPGNLLRSSLVCKPWRGLLAGDGFRRRYGDFHQTPPMLGFFQNWPEPCAELWPTTDFLATSTPAPLFRGRLSPRPGPPSVLG
ncbi:hypothetical protein ZWY2020_043941 [Hordeum vulgare]|nr:hypothetical protein ZWY2020_043941 [Hordeum vulgare]